MRQSTGAGVFYNSQTRSHERLTESVCLQLIQMFSSPAVVAVLCDSVSTLSAEHQQHGGAASASTRAEFPPSHRCEHTHYYSKHKLLYALPFTCPGGGKRCRYENCVYGSWTEIMQSYVNVSEFTRLYRHAFYVKLCTFALTRTSFYCVVRSRVLFFPEM